MNGAPRAGIWARKQGQCVLSAQALWALLRTFENIISFNLYHFSEALDFTIIPIS